jgi:hypothetical protein
MIGQNRAGGSVASAGKRLVGGTPGLAFEWRPRSSESPACHGDGVRTRNEVMASSDDDGELLRRHVAGDPDAFVAYYRRNLALVLAFFLRRTGDPELAADLAAEVFAAVPRITVFSSDLITEIPHPGACAPFRRGSPSLSAVLQAKDK